MQLHASGARAIAYTRNGLDWTRRFAGIAKAFSIPRQAIVDGEAVVIEDGRTNFSELQAALAAGRQGRAQYYAFDLLYLDRYDLRAVAQIERKRLLKELFDRYRLGPPLHYSEHLAGRGGEMCAHAAKLDWEGIVSKNPAAPYRSDRNEGWIKVKTAKRGVIPVARQAPPEPKAAWVEPSFFAEVEYRDITSEGLLRQSSFKGLTKRG